LISLISASIGHSLSKIRILSPILKGKEKKMIIPAVTLLSIDHWAKKATPITVRMEEIKRNIWSGFTPHMETITTETKVAKRKSMYFFTNCTRALGKCALCPKRFTKESAKRLRIKNRIKVTTVAMICGYLSNTKSNIISYIKEFRLQRYNFFND
jgi:hypothetical protein